MTSELFVKKSGNVLDSVAENRIINGANQDQAPSIPKGYLWPIIQDWKKEISEFWAKGSASLQRNASIVSSRSLLFKDSLTNYSRSELTIKQCEKFLHSPLVKAAFLTLGAATVAGAAYYLLGGIGANITQSVIDPAIKNLDAQSEIVPSSSNSSVQNQGNPISNDFVKQNSQNYELNVVPTKNEDPWIGSTEETVLKQIVYDKVVIESNTQTETKQDINQRGINPMYYGVGFGAVLITSLFCFHFKRKGPNLNTSCKSQSEKNSNDGDEQARETTDLSKIELDKDTSSLPSNHLSAPPQKVESENGVVVAQSSLVPASLFPENEPKKKIVNIGLLELHWHPLFDGKKRSFLRKSLFNKLFKDQKVKVYAWRAVENTVVKVAQAVFKDCEIKLHHFYFRFNTDESHPHFLSDEEINEQYTDEESAKLKKNNVIVRQQIF